MGKSTTKFQICSSSSVCVGVVVSCLFLTCFMGYDVSATASAVLVTVPVLVLSSVFVLKFIKKKKKKKEVTLDENPVQEENPISCEVETCLGNDDQIGEKVEVKMQTLMENVQENPVVENFLGNFQVGEEFGVKMEALMENEAQENPVPGKVSNFIENDEVGEKLVKEKLPSVMENLEENEAVVYGKEPDFDFLSETESSTSGDEDEDNLNELDWMSYKNNTGGHQNEYQMMMMMRTCSDSVSSEDDEDGLIEISIPGSEEEENDQDHHDHDQDQDYSINMKQQQPESDAHSDFNEAMNEEENLIEIDISIGSIKCFKV